MKSWKEFKEKLGEVQHPSKEEVEKSTALMIKKRKKKVKVSYENIIRMDETFAIMIIKYMEYFKRENCHDLDEDGLGNTLDEIILGFTKYMEYESLHFESEDERQKYYKEEVESRMMLFVTNFQSFWD